MCHAVRCRTCHKTTWSGCGAHIAQVKARVPTDQWCDGHTTEAVAPLSWVRRLLGRTFS